MARGAHLEPYKGIQFANVHPLIGNLASRPEGGVDWALVTACRRRPSRGGITLDELLDLAEIDEVGRSWRDAYQANGELANGHDDR